MSSCTGKLLNIIQALTEDLNINTNKKSYSKVKMMLIVYSITRQLYIMHMSQMVKQIIKESSITVLWQLSKTSILHQTRRVVTSTQQCITHSIYLASSSLLNRNSTDQVSSIHQIWLLINIFSC